VTAAGTHLVLVHGFTQTGRSMHPLARLLATRLAGSGPITWTAPDAPGHGDRSDQPLDPAAAAQDLADRAGAGTWIGYSMGARLGLHVALHRPDVVDRLVLIGGTPGIEDPAERRARRDADDALADEIERIGVAAFLDRWLTQPMFAGLPDDPDGLAERRRNTAAGLAGSLRLSGTGAQEPIWDRLAEIAVPVLVLAGERDDKFVAIGRRMAASLPRAAFETVAGAGHAAHAEQPEPTADAIARWLETTPSIVPDARADQPPSASPSASSAP
jgi:2-succinyl-6-hydroxy-2,4-cyclohexadiene-1-carboxylate synthase